MSTDGGRHSGKPHQTREEGGTVVNRSLVLASSSPRREKLLGQVGIPFTIETPDVEEYSPGISDPRGIALEAARLKSDHVARRHADSSLVVLAADTIIVVDGVVIGKPRDLDDARSILRTLQGRSHQVLTGFVLTDCLTHRSEAGVVETTVTFRPLSDQVIEWYVSSGEPLEKAGAYGIQGLGALLVSGIDGDYYSVVGLPLCQIAVSLEKLGVAL